MSSQTDDGAGLLSESTYEILNESTLAMTDDDDDGSSVNSFDDDCCSLEDITHIEDTESLQDYQSDIHDPPGIPSFGGLDEFQLSDSAHTLKEDGESTSRIEFEEPPHKNGMVSVVHTLREFNAEESLQILSRIRVESPPDRLLCTVRQTMAQELLCLDEPFRFLYVGSASAKDEIFNKLGAALALPVVECASSTTSSDSKSSRFNVVPITSFGMKSSPEVELIESFGVEMALDVCSHAGRTKVPDRPDTLSLCLNTNQWIRSIHGDSGFTLELGGWKLPHLAVIFCSDEDSLEQKLTRIYTRSFLARHSVPTLVISQKPPYNKPIENYSLDTRSIHMCLESRSPKSGDIIYRRLPIDLATFTNLDVRQMNRNLACVTGLARATDNSAEEEEDGRPQTAITPLLGDVEKRPYSWDDLTPSIYWGARKKPRDIFMLVAIGWLFILGLVGAFFTTAYIKYSRTGAADLQFRTTSSTATSTVTHTHSPLSSASTTQAIAVAKVSVPSSFVTSSPSCVHRADITNLLEPTALAANDSQEFRVHIIGENNIILRPPQKYTSSRKPPPLIVEVTRAGEPIKSELSKLFDGVYTVVIPKDDAWGLLNISVQTKSKPLIQERFELDFGTSWLTLTEWKRLMSQKQDEVMSMIEDASLQGKRIANDIRQVTSQLKEQTKELLVSTAKEVTDDLSKHASRLLQKTPSFKKSFSFRRGSVVMIRKAQRQAVHVWERMDKVKEKLSSRKCEDKCDGGA